MNGTHSLQATTGGFIPELIIDGVDIVSTQLNLSNNNLTSANKPAVPHHLPDDGKRISPPDTIG
ncbi:Uncharacterised protein [Pragia fontium]|nr:Uncharacterised protein [Pragia fontium]